MEHDQRHGGGAASSLGQAPVATVDLGDESARGQSAELQGAELQGVVQRKGPAAGLGPDAVHAAARRGASGAGGPLPFQSQIQASFGRHDIGGVQAHTGAAASAATREVGGEAYAIEDQVVFGGAPGLHTAAHEAAHVVQQRAGVHLKGGVGAAGDRYEVHADQVADRVVRGESAEALLDTMAGGGGGPAAVQCYQGPSTTYTEQKSDDTDIPMFETESIDPEVTPEKNIRYTKEEKDHPQLRFADDYSLAVQAAGHSKELFTTEAALGAAENKLAASKSAVVMVKTGSTIKAGGKTLHQVKPGLRKAGLDQAAQRAVSLGSNICVDVAMKVISGDVGRSQHAMLSDDTGTTGSNMTVGGTHAPEIRRLADHVAQTPGVGVSQDSAHGAMQDQSTNPDQIGEAYGRKTREVGFDATAKKLGINKHAKPDVGEGITTYSVGSAEDEGRKDFTGIAPVVRDRIWGYHYAGVVARSLDDKDYATLENYNRTGDIDEATTEVVRQLEEESEAVATTELVGKPQAQLKQAITALVGEVADKENVVKLRMAEILDAKNNEAWYFAMYGEGGGQSFHEQQAASGYFANPLTVKVSKSLNEDIRVFDAPGRLNAMPQPPGHLNPDHFRTANGVRLGTVGQRMKLAKNAADLPRVFGEFKQELLGLMVADYFKAAKAVTAGVGALEGVTAPTSVKEFILVMQYAARQLDERAERAKKKDKQPLQAAATELRGLVNAVRTLSTWAAAPVV